MDLNGRPDWKVRLALWAVHRWLRFARQMCELEDDQRCYEPVSTLCDIVQELRSGGTPEIVEQWVD